MLVQMIGYIILTTQYSTSINTLHKLFKICKLVVCHQLQTVKRFRSKLQLNVPVSFSTRVI